MKKETRVVVIQFIKFVGATYAVVGSILAMILIPIMGVIFLISRFSEQPAPAIWLFGPTAVFIGIFPSIVVLVYVHSARKTLHDPNVFRRVFRKEFSFSYSPDPQLLLSTLRQLSYKDLTLSGSGPSFEISAIRGPQPNHPDNSNAMLRQRIVRIISNTAGLTVVTITPTKWYEYGDFTKSSQWILNEVSAVLKKSGKL